MEIQRQNGTLSICGLRDLSTASVQVIQNRMNSTFGAGLKRIEIDLSVVDFVDCGGVGAVVSLYNSANGKNQEKRIALCLLNPRPSVRQMFELTGTHHLFEILPAMSEPA
jgi:anti-anti-sigma factor